MKILGYYKKKKGRSEYVLYEEKGELYITNGVYIWNNHKGRIEKRYLPQLNKVSEINLYKIVELLNEFYKFAEITKTLNNILSSRKETA